jgi:hypothetical protein
MARRAASSNEKLSPDGIPTSLGDKETDRPEDRS